MEAGREVSEHLQAAPASRRGDLVENCFVFGGGGGGHKRGPDPAESMDGRVWIRIVPG
ncbi:MAG: hypothetical protein ACO3YY_10110 [Phycisphaerales bacterium]